MTIVSFKHKFIFLKTKKVAGTSVQAALRPFTGPEDIVTCVTPRDEYYSAQKGNFSRNYAVNRLDEERYTGLVLERKFDQALKFFRNMEKTSVSHMKIERIKRIVEERGFKLDDFYKFTIERHPYRWIISSVAYNNAKYNRGTLNRLDDDEIAGLVKTRLETAGFKETMNWNMYTVNNELMVDDVLKYEHLGSELVAVLKKLDLGPENLQLPELKASARDMNPDSILDEGLKKEIRQRFHRVFRLMGYA